MITEKLLCVWAIKEQSNLLEMKHLFLIEKQFTKVQTFSLFWIVEKLMRYF